MAFIENLLARAARDNKLNKALYQSWWSYGLPINSSRNYSADLVMGYNSNEVIYSIINKIAKPAANVPLRLVDRNGEVVTNHWAQRLIDRPNEDNSISDVLFSYYVYLLSIGNSFLYAPKLSDGRTIEMMIMPSNVVDIVAGNWKNPVKGYVVRYGSTEEVIDKPYVMHGRLFNPKFTDSGNWQYGLSPIEVAAEVLRLLDAGTERQALLAETGGPPFIISSQVAEGLTKPQQELLEDTYKKKYLSGKEVNLPMMTGTPVTVHQVGTNAADLELIKASENATRVLCNIYGIDSVLLNDKAASTYNNVIELKKDLYTSTIMPMNSSLANKLTNWLIPEEDVRFEFDYSEIEVLSQSVDERMKALNDVTFLTDNEKREIFGREPLTTNTQKDDETN